MGSREDRVVKNSNLSAFGGVVMVQLPPLYVSRETYGCFINDWKNVSNSVKGCVSADDFRENISKLNIRRAFL